MNGIKRVERHTTVSASDFADANEALAWTVQVLDREFKGATMVKLSIDQIMRCDAGIESEWEYVWSASVSGLREEGS
jgi:hypothetical protein